MAFPTGTNLNFLVFFSNTFLNFFKVGHEVFFPVQISAVAFAFNELPRSLHSSAVRKSSCVSFRVWASPWPVVLGAGQLRGCTSSTFGRDSNPHQWNCTNLRNLLRTLYRMSYSDCSKIVSPTLIKPENSWIRDFLRTLSSAGNDFASCGRFNHRDCE